ncbi:flagellar biosynthesis repressor FlbT [Notoacmeibacter ruber]|uniref:Probable flagellum biosynthesis repressor protein FlbT n=1 Tax=Notoacmeibacter ruber TaxID=2670375 RepID=A0A3L7JEG0_9HYPH|nr:flagellar biosynthesis repressor FlbT [Notoacmeibacter ruber]RLQ88844.1 flagellar biosynthesis repressor FlbT [Notoacmeibacter ruber]
MNGFKISLKANEKIYINGAIIRFDRKTSMEILNDVDFLLENHILQAEDATTPLKQLYFVVQLMLMTPGDIEASMAVYRQLLPSLLSAFENEKVVSELKIIDRQVHEKRYFEAMRGIRQLYPIEAAILDARPDARAAFEIAEPPLQRAAG